MNFINKQSGHKRRKRLVQRESGGVKYLDASILKRPFDPPKHIWTACAVCALIAAIIGGCLSYRAIDQILHGAERQAATVEENINRDVSYDLPQMTTLIGLDDETILQQFIDAGYITYQFSEEDEDLDVMKLPSDVSLTDATVALSDGIGSMDAVTASEYLVGSWRFTSSRDSGITMSVRYADLRVADAQEAIQTALDSQGWTIDEGVEFQTDSVGNTYVEGTIETDVGTCTWRVAACDLSAVYSISDLPETAQYVGIHLTLS